MAELTEVHVPPRQLSRFRPILGDEAVDTTLSAAKQMTAGLRGRVIWNVNSTAVGGGVAEMLQPILGYARGAGVDTRWVVINGDSEFFNLTKRIHHSLHGSRGDGRPLDAGAHEVYQATSRRNVAELCGLVQSGDVVILHDPQTAGLAPELLRHGAHVVWRCHIGHDKANAEVDAGWGFLEPYLRDVPGYVFSRREYVPSVLDGSRAHVIQPSIDAFSAKNAELSETVVHTILVLTGLVEGPPPENLDAGFTRADGTPSRVERFADVIRLGRAPTWDAPLVVQVSRWDPLKDMLGVMQGFAKLVERGGADGAHLVLAGPNVKGVADDPEAPAIFAEVVDASRALPQAIRGRVHLAMLPVSDVEENAAIVNALQRHATVVVQKSLHEGFGLTVTEAMWKARPVIASAVGGINDQIVDMESGLLLKDPTDLDEFATTLQKVLQDPELARRLGDGAKARATEHFLGIRHLLQYAALISPMLSA